MKRRKKPEFVTRYAWENVPGSFFVCAHAGALGGLQIVRIYRLRMSESIFSAQKAYTPGRITDHTDMRITDRGSARKYGYLPIYEYEKQERELSKTTPNHI